MRSLTRATSAAFGAAILLLATATTAQDIDPSEARPPSTEEAAETEAPEPAPTAEVDQERWKPTTHPRLYMHTDDANFLPPGWVEAEAALALIFSELDGQILTTMLKTAPRPGLELRLGWDTLGVVETPASDTITGVGDLFAESKFALDLGPNIDASMHRLAALVHVRPGLGQAPVTTNGLDLGAYAVYTTYPGYVQVNAQAGLSTTILNDDVVLGMPLSGSVSYQAIGWLRVYGELVEDLNLRDLSDSGTRLLGGARWLASPYLSVDVRVALGLSDDYDDAVFLGAVTWRALQL